MKRVRFLLNFISIIMLNFLFIEHGFALDNGFELDNEYQLNTNTSNYQRSPVIATNGSNYFAVWEDLTSRGIYGRFINEDGVSPDSDFTVYYDGNYTQHSAVTSDGENYFITFDLSVYSGGVWNYEIYSLLLDGSGSILSSATQTNTTSANIQWNPAAASNKNGYLAVWASENQDNDGYGVFGQMFNSDGSRNGTEFQVNMYALEDQYYPAAGSNGSTYLVVWEKENEDAAHPYGKADGIHGRIIYANGSIAPTEIKLSSTFDKNPYVGSDGNRYLVVWVSWKDNSVYGRFVDNDGEIIGDKFKIDTGNNINQYEPSVSFNGYSYLVTWYRSIYPDPQSPQGYPDIIGQFLNSNGEKIGSEFTVNGYTSDFQTSPSSASIGGNFFIVWDSKFSAGNQYGVFGRRMGVEELIITSQPQDVVAEVGGEAVFRISAISSGGGLGYQWYMNDFNLVGDNSNTLTISNIDASFHGAQISCYVSDDNGTTRSEIATLNVASPIEIIQQPASQQAYPGEPVTFYVDATSISQTHYQWYLNGEPIWFDTSAFTFYNPQLADNDSEIYCVISNVNTSVTSDTAKLTIKQPSFTVTINGPSSIKENTPSQYNAVVRRQNGEESDITNSAQWEILELYLNANISQSGLLTNTNVGVNTFITLRATYSDGAETHWRDFFVFIENSFQVVGITPSNGSVSNSDISEISVSFSEEVNLNSINGDTCYLLKAGADGIFQTQDDINIPLSIFSSQDNVNFVFDLTNKILPNDTYQLRLSGVQNAYLQFLDGEFSGEFPSGNGVDGGDFISSFKIDRQISLFVLNNDGTFTIQWFPFKDGAYYRVDYTEDINNPQWAPAEPASQWPITGTQWTGGQSNRQSGYFRVISVDN